MKNLLLGFIAGIFLASVFSFYLPFGPRFRIQIGRMLDVDTIYLKDGSTVQGRIIKKDDKQIWVELKKGYFVLLRSECEIIRENDFLQYIRKMM